MLPYRVKTVKYFWYISKFDKIIVKKKPVKNEKKEL